VEKKLFDIKSDLKGRELRQQVEILWISGTTWHDAAKIAKILGLTETQVLKIIRSINQPTQRSQP